MPLLSTRIHLLRTASFILSSPATTPLTLITSASNSAAALVNLLTSTLPAHFDDTTTYHSRRIHLQKRAQILVADLWACFNGKEGSPGHFTDIDSALTMFADYRVPQMLQRLGCLWYSPRLEGRIRRGEVLEAGEPMEVELRACSVWCVELLRRDMVRRGWGSWEVEVEGEGDGEVETSAGAPLGTDQGSSSTEDVNGADHTTKPPPSDQSQSQLQSATTTPSPHSHHPPTKPKPRQKVTLNAILLDYLLYDTAKELEAAETPTSHSPPNGTLIAPSPSANTAYGTNGHVHGIESVQHGLAGVALTKKDVIRDPDGPRTLPHHRTRGIWY
jgi:hypothetical protein